MYMVVSSCKVMGQGNEREEHTCTYWRIPTVQMLDFGVGFTALSRALHLLQGSWTFSFGMLWLCGFGRSAVSLHYFGPEQTA